MNYTSQIADRLDRVVAALAPQLSRSSAQKLIAQGAVLVNGATRPSSYAVAMGDTITISQLPQPADALPQPEAIPLDIVYEDDDVLVINKAAGMVVHPGVGNASGTLVNAVLAHMPDIADVGEAERPGIVHRLDKETSGVMLLAKNASAQLDLKAQFHDRVVHKTYIAVVLGHIQPARGIINKPIGRDPHHRQRMAIVPTGRVAVTEYQLVKSADTANGVLSLLKAYPQTGRTHQLRVHFESVGFPIIGDALYGGSAIKNHTLSKRLTPRHMLHAGEISFRLPSTGAMVTFQAAVPPDMQAVIDLI
ncbi:MAG: RluA family pseudouridine synthase [Anaerolineae bacterium]|nr:RluA family pseudouridine synthase [Anaerolineae bacterium]